MVSGSLHTHRQRRSDGFEQLPQSSHSNMPSPHRAEEIPLEKVITSTSTTGARRPSFTTGANTAVGSTEAIRPHLGRRKTGGLELNDEDRKSHSDEDGTLTRMGRIYQKVVNFSVITRYLIYVLPVAAVLAIPIICGFTVAKTARVGGVRMVWFFVWLEVVWSGIWVSKIFAHFLPAVFQFLAGVVSPGVRKYYLIIKALQIPISLFGWALISLLTFAPLMTDNPDTTKDAEKDKSLQHLQPGFQSVMGQLLGAALVCSVVYLVERFLIQMISINYHRKQFHDKIKDNKRSIFLLALLYDASRAMFPAYCSEFLEEDYIINDALNLSALGGKKNHRGSTNPLRLLQNVGHNVGRVGDKVGAAFGAVAQEITGKRVFDLESGHSIVVEALEKTRSCEALARRLWFSFVMEGNENLYEKDVIEVLGPDKKDEAEEAFHAIDRDGNGDISLEEMVMTITEIGRTRKAIASSMHDVDQAIHVLDSLLLVVVFVVCVFIIVGFVQKSFVSTLATAGTALLSMSFVFATTAQEFLGSCIFLFVKHPFDIGDRVDITKEQLVVERISLLFCVFKRITDGRIVQIPNIVLNTLWVDNLTRSKAMRDQISVFCHFDTTFDDIKTLKAELVKFLTDKENNRDFHSDLEIEVIGIAELTKLELRVDVRHKSNWSNETLRAARRSKFMCALVMALRRVPIYGPGAGDAALGSANAPTYSVALTADVAQQNKDDFASKKEAKRLIQKPAAEESPAEPTSPFTGANAAATTTGAEYLAMSSINQRAVGPDPMRDETWAMRDDDTLDDRTSFDQADGQDQQQALINRQPSQGRRRPAVPQDTAYFTGDRLPPRGPSNISYASPPAAGQSGAAAYDNFPPSQWSGPSHRQI